MSSIGILVQVYTECPKCKSKERTYGQFGELENEATGEKKVGHYLKCDCGQRWFAPESGELIIFDQDSK